MKAWDLGDYLIGDQSKGRDVPLLQSAKMRKKMHQAALHEVDATNAGAGQLVPSMPTYTFNRYDSVQYGFDGARKVKIDAVVRFVSHFDVG